MTRTVVIATKNPGKVREIREVLSEFDLTIESLERFGAIPEPEETGTTFAENARQKALYYARATGQWALADDSGLEVDALGGEPGVYSARYAAEQAGPDADRDAIDNANNAKVLTGLTDVPDEQRTARFVCHLALADVDGILLEARGTIEGRIGHAPRGDNGFGYDPLFYVPDRGKTTAELPPSEKNAISHRGSALRSLVEQWRTMCKEYK
jgi:XTP/dITP diphosphohydrolase